MKKQIPISDAIFAFVPVVRQAKRPKEAADALELMGVKDVSLENRLEVRASGDENEIVLIGAVGKSWWDDSGITESEVRDALKSIPKGKQITISINSEGGSVKEGLGIYNAIKERNSDIKVRVAGYALSIASVIPLAAKKSLGGRGVVSPKAAIWMEHNAWTWASGNAKEMRQTADMLDAHDETLVDIYSAATGRSKEDCRTRMAAETWTKGSAAIECGMADETDEEKDASAAYRPLHPDYLARCKNLSPEIMNSLRANTSAVDNGGQQTTKANQMNKKTIVALLKKHGIEASETETEEQLQAKLDKIPTVAAPKTEPAKTEPANKTEGIDDIRAELAAQKRARVEDKINTFVDEGKCTKAEAKIFIAQALASEESFKEVCSALDERQPMNIGGEAAGMSIELGEGNGYNKDGIFADNQRPKVVNELTNIFNASKEPLKRWEMMKAEWPKLIKAAARRDAGVIAGNTFSATITTNFLILGVTTKLFNRFAPAKLFAKDNSVDPYKPLATGIQKFNTTATDGSGVAKNATNFATLVGESNGNPDSTITAPSIDVDQYTSGGYITNAELNSGFRMSDIVLAKLIDLASKTTQVLTAPITVANFVTNAPLVSAAAAFGFDSLATLQGQLKKSLIKNLLLDGEYQARIANTPGFFQSAGLTGGPAGAWSAFGWDNVALNTDWTGAGANVRGFACNPQAIGIITGLPLNPPEGIPGNIVQMGTAMVPDVDIALATYVWFDSNARTLRFTYDLMAGSTLLDETAGVLIKSA